MYSVLLFAATMLVCSPNVQPTDSANPSDPPGQQRPNMTELDVMPTFICGMVVNEDKKTIEEQQKHEQPQSDSCKVHATPEDGPMLDVSLNTSTIA